MKQWMILGIMAAAWSLVSPVRGEDVAATAKSISSNVAQIASTGRTVEDRLEALEYKVEQLLRLIEDGARNSRSPFFELDRQMTDIDRRLDRIERDVDDIGNDVRRIR
jgi:hypothetical protein